MRSPVARLTTATSTSAPAWASAAPAHDRHAQAAISIFFMFVLPSVEDYAAVNGAGRRTGLKRSAQIVGQAVIRITTLELGQLPLDISSPALGLERTDRFDP